jgi:hypothetical protein
MVPVEIIGEIVGYLSDKQPLKTCSLLGSQWAQATRPHLFRELSVKFSDLGSFYLLIKSPRCTIRYHVRTLILTPGGGFRNGVFLLPEDTAVWEAA